MVIKYRNELEASKPKWVNPVLNIIWVNSLRHSEASNYTNKFISETSLIARLRAIDLYHMLSIFIIEIWSNIFYL